MFFPFFSENTFVRCRCIPILSSPKAYNNIILCTAIFSTRDYKSKFIEPNAITADSYSIQVMMDTSGEGR